MITTNSTVNGSAEDCKAHLDEVQKLLNIAPKEKHFWEGFSQKQIDLFKKEARAAGMWTQFPEKWCNSWSRDPDQKEKCDGCSCSGEDFTDTGCTPNCECCWWDKNEYCPPKNVQSL